MASSVARSTIARVPKTVVPAAAPQQKRFAHDLLKHPGTGRPIISHGPGGRHSSTGHVATVFGSTGFLSRYLIAKLAKKGTQVIVPYRNEDDKRHLRVMGDLGQIVPLEWNLRNDSQIEECVRHSDVVYNCVGRDWQTKNFSYNDVHVEGARRIARISAQSGVSKFIHVSHLNADRESRSSLYRSKAEGEDAVRDAFAGATIVRPGLMYGHEDRFLNKMVKRPWTYRVNGLETKVKPVHVLDVAEALNLLLTAGSSVGRTFSLPGPETLTYEQLFKIVESLTYRRLSNGPQLPEFVFKAMARVWENIWWPTISPDEVTRRFVNDLENEVGTDSWEYFGMKPDSVREVGIQYLRHYRPSVFADVPIQEGGIKLKQRTYHVVD